MQRVRLQGAARDARQPQFGQHLAPPVGGAAVQGAHQPEAGAVGDSGAGDVGVALVARQRAQPQGGAQPVEPDRGPLGGGRGRRAALDVDLSAVLGRAGQLEAGRARRRVLGQGELDRAALAADRHGPYPADVLQRDPRSGGGQRTAHGRVRHLQARHGREQPLPVDHVVAEHELLAGEPGAVADRAEPGHVLVEQGVRRSGPGRLDGAGRPRVDDPAERVGGQAGPAARRGPGQLPPLDVGAPHPRLGELLQLALLLALLQPAGDLGGGAVGGGTTGHLAREAAGRVPAVEEQRELVGEFTQVTDDERHPVGHRHPAHLERVRHIAQSQRGPRARQGRPQLTRVGGQVVPGARRQRDQLRGAVVGGGRGGRVLLEDRVRVAAAQADGALRRPARALAPRPLPQPVDHVERRPLQLQLGVGGGVVEGRGSSPW